MTPGDWFKGSESESLRVTDACQEFASLAARFVQLGGKLDEIIDGPFVVYEAYGCSASGASNSIAPGKLSNDFLKRLATLQARTRQLEQEQISVGVPDHTPFYHGGGHV